MAVSWLSAFPNDDEKLFHGLHVRFKISDIVEGATLQKHNIELKLFNTCQRLLNNFDINWNQSNKGKKMIEISSTFIKWKQDPKRDVENEVDQITSKYCRDLFEYFCNHRDMKQITIRNFTLPATSLYESLFSPREQIII